VVDLAQEKKAVDLAQEKKVVDLAQENKAVDPRAQKAAHTELWFVEPVRS